ncbi:MAG: MarR family transcriptional regulator [Anaerolineae bacterium]|nr:MarR family transcriptional regulator [Anaerolineae bacterium]
MGLNERQIEALRLIANEGREMTNAKYQGLFEVSRRTATRDLKALLKTGWVRQKGTGKGTRYVAN